MTVLYFADTRFPIERANGAQTMATCLALAERGHQVTLVVRPDTAHPPRDPFEFYGAGATPLLHIVAVPSSRWTSLRRVRYLARARRLVRRHPHAVVYTRDLGVAVALLTSGGPALATRLVFESHGIAPIVSRELPALLGRADLTPPASKLERLDRRERLVWQRAGAYVTITQALADDLAARYGPREHVYVVPDGANAPADAPGAPDAGPPIAAYAGHLYPWKGVDVFVRALAAAPGVRGLLIGGHPQEADVARIRALAATLGLGDRLEMIGQVPAREVARYLARASFLVLPNTASAISERYTSPLKLFEYLWMGRAIVASDLPALREVLSPTTARFVPPGDAAALAAALEDLAARPVVAAALGAAARALAPDFTWARRAERLEPALAVARGAA